MITDERTDVDNIEYDVWMRPGDAENIKNQMDLAGAALGATGLLGVVGELGELLGISALGEGSAAAVEGGEAIEAGEEAFGALKNAG